MGWKEEFKKRKLVDFAYYAKEGCFFEEYSRNFWAGSKFGVALGWDGTSIEVKR